MSTGTGVKPTVVIIPGAWHHPSPAFDPLIALLNASGYPTIPITLPSAGSVVTLADDVAAIRSAVVPVVEEQGKEVVIVMHSYGGVPGTDAVQGLARAVREKEGKAGGVIRLVYIAAIVPAVGEDVIEWSIRNSQNSRDSGVAPLAPSERRFTGDGLVFNTAGAERFYNDLDPERATELARGLTAQSLAVFKGKLSYGAYLDVPSAYLVCMKDRSIGWKAQEAMAKDAGSEMVERVESGHTPTLSMPHAVASFVRRAAGEKLLSRV